MAGLVIAFGADQHVGAGLCRSKIIHAQIKRGHRADVVDRDEIDQPEYTVQQRSQHSAMEKSWWLVDTKSGIERHPDGYAVRPVPLNPQVHVGNETLGSRDPESADLLKALLVFEEHRCDLS